MHALVPDNWFARFQFKQQIAPAAQVFHILYKHFDRKLNIPYADLEMKRTAIWILNHFSSFLSIILRGPDYR